MDEALRREDVNGKMISRLKHGRTVHGIVLMDVPLRCKDVNKKSRLERGRKVHVIVLLDKALKHEEGKGNKIIVGGER